MIGWSNNTAVLIGWCGHKHRPAWLTMPVLYGPLFNAMIGVICLILSQKNKENSFDKLIYKLSMLDVTTELSVVISIYRS